MDILNFDEFYYEVQFALPAHVLKGDKWHENIELIREIIFDFYNIYKNTCLVKDGYIVSEMNPSRASQLLTLIFTKLENYQII